MFPSSFVFLKWKHWRYISLSQCLVKICLFFCQFYYTYENYNCCWQKQSKRQFASMLIFKFSNTILIGPGITYVAVWIVTKINFIICCVYHSYGDFKISVKILNTELLERRKLSISLKLIRQEKKLSHMLLVWINSFSNVY